MFQRLLTNFAQKSIVYGIQPSFKVTSRGHSTLTKEEVKALQRKCQGLGVFLTVISFAGVVGYWKMDGFNSCVDMKMPAPMVVSAVDPKTGEEEESS